MTRYHLHYSHCWLSAGFEPVKSRFKPLVLESWMQKFYASPVDFGGGVPGSQPAKV